MNSASQNFPRHLGMLRERMLHPTDYELAVNYFLEEFAGDVAFVRGSEPEQMPHLVAVLNIVVAEADPGRHVEVENTLVSYLREHCFVHGNAQADGGELCCSSTLRTSDTGLLMLIPGIRGQMEVARFHLKGDLPDPRWNWFTRTPRPRANRKKSKMNRACPMIFNGGTNIGTRPNSRRRCHLYDQNRVVQC